ncbi:hypothetical protein [Bartonella acomydis]|uniref:Conjugal transfer protein TrbH n=1 Tax=Bartonella acomydis TaxID=686234 RepID=A0ABP9MEI1_9HYPH
MLLLSLLLTAGCASISDRSSNYIDRNLTNGEAKLIANDFVRNLKTSLPLATTILTCKKSNTEDNFTPLFITLLQQNGYDLISTDQAPNSKTEL